MMHRPTFLATLLLVGTILGFLGLAGCGEKIAIPQAEGLFSVSGYQEFDTFDSGGATQVLQLSNLLYALTPNALVKLDQDFAEIIRAEGLVQAAAMCAGPEADFLFVWDQGTHTMHWYAVTDLALAGSVTLPEIQEVRGIAANSDGIDQVPGTDTFLYVSDPGAGVVRRFIFDEFNGLTPYGILAFAAGDGARSVHVAAGMATDSQGRLLVCDEDTLRNWVIRFDSTPDLEDSQLRGTAVVFAESCNPPAAADYVLGNAPICQQTDWVGGPSIANGEFNRPTAVAVDGEGSIFVADSGNNRIQLLSAVGMYVRQFGDTETCPGPQSLAVVDVSAGGKVYYGALVYVLAGDDLVHQFASNVYSDYLASQNPDPRP